MDGERVFLSPSPNNQQKLCKIGGVWVVLSLFSESRIELSEYLDEHDSGGV